MYILNSLNIEYVILCPNRDIYALKGSHRWINRDQVNDNISCLCICPSNTTKGELAEMRAICPTYKGKSSFLSLLNEGIKKSSKDWILFLYAGSYIRPKFTHRYHMFMEDEKDIMFPIVDKFITFDEGSMNGMLMHRNVHKDVGLFDDSFDIPISKLIWANRAIESGYKFKAILGTKTF